MAETNSMITTRPPSTMVQLKSILSTDTVKAKFTELLGNKAPQFMASIINAVSSSDQLKNCEANSIIGGAYVAASYDLPIDSNLGFAAIVPFKSNKKNKDTGKWESRTLGQFQMMYKGFIQLAIRSGQYKNMNCSAVYEDELKSYNPITGECSFVDDFSICKQRMNGETDKIIGYYAWYELLTGFRKELYMSKVELDNHAKKYSPSYINDVKEGKNSSRWSTDFDGMAKKTVIKQLLSKWGILSIDMQRAIIDDQKVYDENGDGTYSDNQPLPVITEDPFETAVSEADAAEFAEFEKIIN